MENIIVIIIDTSKPRIKNISYIDISVKGSCKNKIIENSERMQ